MKTSGMGGKTTVTVAGNTVTISTTNLLDYRRLLKRLTAANRTVNDSTHAVFTFPANNRALYRAALKCMDERDQLRLKYQAVPFLHDEMPLKQDSVAVTRT